jgi:hypothetical protein
MKINLLEKSFILAVLLISLNFLIRIITLPYFLASNSIHASNIDTFLWSYCAYELANKGYVSIDIKNYIEFSTTIKEPIRPYLQGCFFSLGYTFIAYIFFKIFKSLYFMFYLNFIILLLCVYLMYLILKLSYNDNFVNSLILLISSLNTYIFIFALKIRPDIFSFFFALLSWFFIMKNRYIIAGIFLSISVFLFKVQMITWFLPLCFIIWYYSRNFKNILKFFMGFIAFMPFSLIFYLYAYLNFHGLIGYLKTWNVHDPISNLNKIFKNIFNITYSIGLLSPTGILYLLTAAFSDTFPRRSFQVVFLLPFGLTFLHKLLKKSFKYIIPLIIILLAHQTCVTGLEYFVFSKKEKEFYNEIISLAKENKKLCFVNNPYLSSLKFIGKNVDDSKAIWLSFYGYENVEIKDRLKIILNYCEKNSYIVYYDMSIYDTDGKIIKNFSSTYSLKSLRRLLNIFHFKISNFKKEG